MIPYLLGVEKGDLEGPFATLNVASVNREDSLRVLQTLNNNLPVGSQLTAQLLRESFDMWYPGFEKDVQEIAKVDAKPRESPSPADQFEFLKQSLGSLQSQIRTLSSELQVFRDNSWRISISARVDNPNVSGRTDFKEFHAHRDRYKLSLRRRQLARPDRRVLHLLECSI